MVTAINIENYTDFKEVANIFVVVKGWVVFFLFVCFEFGVFFKVKGATRMLTEQPRMPSTEALCEVKGDSELELI